MSFLEAKTKFSALGETLLPHVQQFDCGNEDLNEFFKEDCIKYSEQLLGKTYCFHLEEDESKIVALFTVSNDSLKVRDLPRSRKEKVIREMPRGKHISSYPSVLIGRLGLNKEYKGIITDGKSIGDELMDFIKAWFVHPNNKTGCRFVVVDAYNEDKVLGYYHRNGFRTLFSTEDQEANYFGRDEARTRLMYFDLITLNPSE